MGKNSRTGSGKNNPDHISESLKTIFWLLRIRGGKNSDPGFFHPGTLNLILFKSLP
jgi:hypothetical protein